MVKFLHDHVRMHKGVGWGREKRKQTCERQESVPVCKATAKRALGDLFFIHTTGGWILYQKHVTSSSSNVFCRVQNFCNTTNSCSCFLQTLIYCMIIKIKILHSFAGAKYRQIVQSHLTNLLRNIFNSTDILLNLFS